MPPRCPTTGRLGLVKFLPVDQGMLTNRYEVVRPIGSGAMTTVLEARDRREGHRVALKVLVERLARDEAFLERLEREASAAAALSHPNIATVHAVGRDGRARFVVAELVDGSSVRDLLAVRGPLAPAGAARVGVEVCAALVAAHERGVTHGHLTLANVLLAIDGRVKVTDFRLAQAARPQASAPDPSADLRRLGRCLAAMLTGREPASGEPVRLGPGVPAELVTIVARAAGDPDSGYRWAADLGRDLDRFRAAIRPGATATVQLHPPTGQPTAEMQPAAPARQRTAPEMRPPAPAGQNGPPVVVAAASSQTAQLVPSSAAGVPGHRATSAVGQPRTRRVRRLAVAAGLAGAGLVVVGVAAAVGLLGREPTGPVTSPALAPATTAVLSTTTSQPATSRAPGTTGRPTTTLDATVPPAATSPRTTTGKTAGPAQRVVPDVVGLHRGQAADVLAQAQLGVQVVLVTVFDSGQVKRVVAQQPSAGQVVPARSEVTLLVGTRRPTG